MAYLANAMETLALTKLVLHLPRTLFGLFQATHGVGLLAVLEEDVAQVKVCTEEILQELTLPFKGREKSPLTFRKPVAFRKAPNLLTRQ